MRKLKFIFFIYLILMFSIIDLATIIICIDEISVKIASGTSPVNFIYCVAIVFFSSIEFIISFFIKLAIIKKLMKYIKDKINEMDGK